MVRADRRGAAGQEVVLERVSGEFRLGPGIHRRVELASDVWVRTRRPRRNFRRVDRRAPDRPRRAAALPLRSAGGGRDRQRLPVRAPGLVRQPARRLLAWREGQPRLAGPAEAGGVRAARDGQAADGEGRRRRGRQRQGRLHRRCDRQLRGERARRIRRLRRVHLTREPGGRRDQQRLPLGHRRGDAVAQEPAADRGTARRGVFGRRGRGRRRRSSPRTVPSRPARATSGRRSTPRSG